MAQLVRSGPVAGGDLAAAADYDLCSRGDHGAGVGGLLAHSAVAGDLYGKPGGGRLLNDFAHGEAEKRWDLKTPGLNYGDCRGLLRRRL